MAGPEGQRQLPLGVEQFGTVILVFESKSIICCLFGDISKKNHRLEREITQQRKHLRLFSHSYPYGWRLAVCTQKMTNLYRACTKSRM